MSEQVPTAQDVTRISKLAVASVVLGILGFPFPWFVVMLSCWQGAIAGTLLPPIFGIASLAFGVIALNQICKSGGRMKGRGLAIVGLLAGGVSLLFIGYLFLHPLDQRVKFREADCLSNVKTIGLACAMYADSHDGRLPRSFEDLTNVIKSDKVFVCPSAKDQTHYSYAFTGATNVWGVSANTVVLLEIEANHQGKRALLFDDGHAEMKSDAR
jgi:hypothetical protein